MSNVTLITGANSGIGLATALHLAGTGRTVYGSVRTEAAAARLREKAAEAGVSVSAVLMDVADTQSVRAGVASVLDDAGHIDELVNNAGVAGNAVVEDCDPRVLTEVLNVNVVGVLRCCQAVLPGMRARRRGAIVNISSGLGRVAAPAQAPYVASKWAVEGLSEELAHEVAPFGIRVVIVEPGVTRTAIFRKNKEVPNTPASGAYQAQYERMFAFYAEGFTQATAPKEVGQVIEDALNAAEPALRYTVSWGAAELVAGRATLTDEAWVRLGALDNEAYADAFLRAFGIDLRAHLVRPRI